MDQYILSLSYGKDSLACLGAILELGWPLDRIVHAEVWATDDIPADLPPMVDFKQKADQWIFDNFGITVEHVYATRPVAKRERERERRTYENTFYEVHQRGKHVGELRGFPMQRGPWCNGRLKTAVLDGVRKIDIREDILPQTSIAEGGYQIYGFPIIRGQWCNGFLKRDVLKRLPASRQDGVSIARENSREPSYENHRISNINQERKLVHRPQDKSFLRAP